MSDVTQLPTGKMLSCGQTVEVLEGLLELAKAGEIDSLACVYARGQEAMMAHTALKDATRTVGSLEFLKHKIINE